MGERQTVYEQLGGPEPFHRLANAFYDRVEKDTLLRPMFPGSLTCARRHLALFLIQFFGGPAEYTAQRGSPRLRMRHEPFAIGAEERDHWLGHMLDAIDEVATPEPARTTMREYFTTAATFLINRPAPGSSAIRPVVPVAAPVRVAWDYLVALDAVMGAVRTGDIASLRRRLSGGRLREHLSRNRIGYRDIVGDMLDTRDPAMVGEAYEHLRREPDLVHIAGNDGWLLLHEAAAGWRYADAELLLELGTDPSTRADRGHTPLYFATNHFVRRDPLPAEEGARVARLLLDRGAEVDAESGPIRTRPLHMAARRGHVPIAAVLIEHGADIEARDIDGATPLRRAVNCGHPDIVALLLAHGADPHAPDRRGRTPLDAARTFAVRQLLLGAPSS